MTRRRRASVPQIGVNDATIGELEKALCLGHSQSWGRGGGKAWASPWITFTREHLGQHPRVSETVLRMAYPIEKSDQIMRVGLSRISWNVIE